MFFDLLHEWKYNDNIFNITNKLKATRLNGIKYVTCGLLKRMEWV